MSKKSDTKEGIILFFKFFSNAYAVEAVGGH